MSFTCNGATNIINVQAIAENPKKNIPKAFFIASILVAGVYFLLGYVASGVAPVSYTHLLPVFENLSSLSAVYKS